MLLILLNSTTYKMKNPDRNLGFPEYTLHDGGLGVYSIYIKAVAPAKTTPLYTKSIVRRELISFMNASISPMRCEFENLVLGCPSQKKTKMCFQEWIKDLPLSSTTDITVMVMDGRTSTAGNADVWKVGEL